MNTHVDWPASATALEEGRALLRKAASGHVIVACDHDVDGLASAVLVARTMERLAARVDIVPVGRGEHVHVAAYRDRLAALGGDAYVVTDMGSRAEPIGLGAPTLLIDHHDATAFPPDAVIVSAARRLPVAPTSYLAFELLEPLVAIDDLDWLALLGSVADLGAGASFGKLPAWTARYRKKHVSEAIALLNAARRAPDHDVATALDVLRASRSLADIASGSAPGVARLMELRAEVAAEVQRVARTAPRIHGDVAVIRIRSKAQIHPLLAMRWRSRLRDKIVVVANEDFLPGRVNFVVRSTRAIDLIAWLESLAFGDVGPDFARGHPAATGGSVTKEDFERLLRAIEAAPRRAPTLTSRAELPRERRRSRRRRGSTSSVDSAAGSSSAPRGSPRPR